MSTLSANYRPGFLGPQRLQITGGWDTATNGLEKCGLVDKCGPDRPLLTGSRFAHENKTCSLRKVLGPDLSLLAKRVIISKESKMPVFSGK